MSNKDKLYEIIFESDTKKGKIFDEFLLVFILLSVLTAFIDSIPNLGETTEKIIYYSEWFFTLVFTIEYFLRIYSSLRTAKYIFSFWGMIDLIAILPTYLGLIFTGGNYFMIIRIVRLLRIFRILKLLRYYDAFELLGIALKKSRYKIIVFMMVVAIVVIIMGSLVFVVEGPENGYTSIPVSIYWAITTLTTVGYGDITPQTIGGRFISSLIMLIGYSIIAVPTGIITSDLISVNNKNKDKRKCKNCHSEDHDDNSVFCKYCGAKL
jgi:voltage-gated potassium channel